MVDRVLLRTMARKSIMTGGRHEGLSVQMILDMNGHWKLARDYFRYSMISFQDDILDEIGIPPKYRIEKPGADMDMFIKWCEFNRSGKSDKDRLIASSIAKKNRRLHALRHDITSDKGKAFFMHKNRRTKF